MVKKSLDPDTKKLLKSTDKLIQKVRESNQRKRVYFIALACLSFVLNGAILFYLLRLEKIGCECSYDWRRNYIIGFSIYMMVFSVVEIYLHATNRLGLISLRLSQFNMIGLALFAVFGIQYVNKLQVEKCACFEHVAQRVLNIVAITRGVLVLIFVISLMQQR